MNIYRWPLPIMLLAAACNGDHEQQRGETPFSRITREKPVLRISETRGSQAIPFNELFYSDGRWRFSEQHFASLQAEGTWNENEQGKICVTITRTSWGKDLTGKTICREQPDVSDPTALFATLRAPDKKVPVSYHWN